VPPFLLLVPLLTPTIFFSEHQVDPYGKDGANLQLTATIALNSCDALRHLKSKVIEFTAKSIFKVELFPAINIHAQNVILVSSSITGCVYSNSQNSPGAIGRNGGSSSRCHPGKHSASSASNECVACTPGKFAPAPGLAECKLCLLGLFQAHTGQQSCLRCPAMSIPAANRTLCYTQSTCSAGQYGTLGGACTACPAGKYQSKQHTIHCKFCAKGKYQLHQGEG
jgi:hypothetical protein